MQAQRRTLPMVVVLVSIMAGKLLQAVDRGYQCCSVLVETNAKSTNAFGKLYSAPDDGPFVISVQKV
jgi:hypothetical protein